MNLTTGQVTEFVRALDACDSAHDGETGHHDADEILLDVLQIVEPDVCLAYQRVMGRAEFWATA